MMSMQPVTRAVWSTAYVNRLPDSHFLYIGRGGKKDAEGKTVPRSLRKLPYKDAQGNVDLPHLRNALSRLPQADIPETAKDRIRTRAQRILERETEKETADKRLSDAVAKAAAACKVLRALPEGQLLTLDE